MIYREAEIRDIKQMQFVRHAVKENRLSDPALVPDKDVEEYITNRGKGWVCEVDKQIVGFANVDLIENNVWALFVHPDFEARGIGKKLHQIMMDWYFLQTKEKMRTVIFRHPENEKLNIYPFFCVSKNTTRFHFSLITFHLNYVFYY